MSKARAPDEIIDAEFTAWQSNDTGYDGMRGADTRSRTGYDGIRGAAIRAGARAAARRVPVDARALEAAANEMPSKGWWILGGLAAAGAAFYLYNNPGTLDRLLGDEEE